MAELTGKYINILWDDGSHKYNVRSFLGEIDEILKGERFSGFDQEMLDSVIGSLRERGNSNATINRKMAALSKLLRKAHKMGISSTYRSSSGRRSVWDAFDSSNMRKKSACSPRSSRAVKIVTGSRCSSSIRAAVLRGDRCYLERYPGTQGHLLAYQVESQPNGPLTRRACKASQIPHDKLKGPFSMLNQVRFRQIWNEAKMEVGLGTDDQVVPHILRHTCASRLVRGGIDIRRVQMWLGHQTLQMTMRYAHLATHDLDSCVKVLEVH